MDEKTEELRAIFLDVADEETVTRSQEEGRGSLTGDGDSVDERLRSVIERMHEKFAFGTALSEGELCRVVRLFYDERDDGEIADELGVTRDAVFRARMDLHLLRDEDPPEVDAPPEVRSAVRERCEAGEDPSAVARERDVDGETVDRLRTVVRTRDRARRVSYRFRTAFEEILTDADLTVQFAADAHEDGLEEATEDAETDVQF